MPTGFYLLDNKRAATNFYRQRKGPILGIVVHVTAGLQGRPTGADSSAEQTARYALNVADRKVSWHSGSDRDSHLRLLPDEFVAFHCQGANTNTIGHEISKRDTSWGDEDPRWVTDTLQQAADSLRLRALRWGIPARRATVAELDRAQRTGGPPVGFLAHSDLDPSRRSDPGRDFPWDRFLTLLTAEPGKSGNSVQEDDDMPAVVYAPGKPTCLLRGDGTLYPLASNAEANAYVAAGCPSKPVSAVDFDALDAVSKRITAAR